MKKENKFLEDVYEITNYANRDVKVGRYTLLSLGFVMIYTLIVFTRNGSWGMPDPHTFKNYITLSLVGLQMVLLMTSGLIQLILQIPHYISESIYRKGGAFKLGRFAALPIAIFMIVAVYAMNDFLNMIAPVIYVSLILVVGLILASIVHHYSKNGSFWDIIK